VYGFTGIRNANADMFPQGFYKGQKNGQATFDRSICGKLTLGRWLTEIPKGTDLLTKFTFPSKRQRSQLESMGSIRGHLEGSGPMVRNRPLRSSNFAGSRIISRPNGPSRSPSTPSTTYAC
jgi:hypothetical protein